MKPLLSREVQEALLPSQTGKTMYVTVGNPLRGDDGVAPLIAEHIHIIQPYTILVNADERPECIIDRVVDEHPSKIVIIDAADFKGKKGEVRLFSPSHMPDYALSTHHFPLKIIVRILEDDTGSEVYFIGIQIHSAKLGSPMDESVKESAGAISDFINEAQARAGDMHEAKG